MQKNIVTELEDPILFVALGNPGDRYFRTRHNIGFIFAEYIAKSFQLNEFQYCEKMMSYISVSEQFKKDVVLIKPNTYMNLSGKSVLLAVKAFSVKPNDIFVVHDDVYLDFGVHRLKSGGGGDGGHNGVISIVQELGHSNFNRIKLGVGKPEAYGALKDYVLKNFLDDELSFIDNLWAISWKQIFKIILQKGLHQAMTVFNRRCK